MADKYTQYNEYLQKMQDQFLANAQTIDYKSQSPSALKSALAKMLRPEYDKAIANRQKMAAKNRAAIDTDAASRGMGSSTWVTDVKNRQNDASATDISGLESDYISNLYGNLLDRLSQQEATNLSVAQYNAAARQKALDDARATTDAWWQTFSAKGGGAKGEHIPEDLADYLKWYKQQIEANMRKQQAQAKENKKTVVNPKLGGGGANVATTR